MESRPVWPAWLDVDLSLLMTVSSFAVCASAVIWNLTFIVYSIGMAGYHCGYVEARRAATQQSKYLRFFPSQASSAFAL